VNAVRIELPQLGLVIDDAPAGANLLALLASHKVPLARSCGGDGVCGTCRVQIEGDDVPARSSHEARLHKKQSRVASDDDRYACTIQIPATSKKWVLRTRYW
jgi:ferredoxin